MVVAKLNVRITLAEMMLGTLAGNPQVAKDFIIAKAEDDSKEKEEGWVVDAMNELQKATTFFPRDDKGRFLWDYQLKGFIKEAVGVLVEVGDAGNLTKYSFKKTVDNAIFIDPRRIYLKLPEGTQTEFIERPLRCETMQGERVALARSEAVPSGTTLEACIKVIQSNNEKSKMKNMSVELVKAALDYGALKGLGQWRNSGMGRFTWEEFTVEEKPFNPVIAKA